MTDRIFHILLLTGVLGTGLIAGTFFAFSVFIMPALERLPLAQGAAAMQSINVTVINPVFMVVLFGTAILSGYLGYLAVRQGAHPDVVAGAALYVLGVVGVTLAFNVPLNNELAGLDPAASSSLEDWARFTADWTFWNSARGLAAAASCLAFAASL